MGFLGMSSFVTFGMLMLMHLGNEMEGGSQDSQGQGSENVGMGTGHLPSGQN